jgi:hypothetical protein
MATRTVAAGGTITLGDLTVHRLDFGAMRITGQGVWGEPEDRDEALRAANEHRIPGPSDLGIGRLCGHALLR